MTAAAATRANALAFACAAAAAPCFGAEYSGMTRDLLLRHRPLEHDALFVWHVLFAMAVFGLVAWRVRARDRRRWVVWLVWLGLVVGMWRAGAAAIEWLVAATSQPPWWDPWGGAR